MNKRIFLVWMAAAFLAGVPTLSADAQEGPDPGSWLDAHLLHCAMKPSNVIGLDHNDDTARGKGSVVFSVTAGGKSVFRSEVMRYGTPPREVAVELGGADTFILDIGDAGWYPCEGQWPKIGTWEPDTTRFPRGLRAISDHALAKGVKTLVWFEPERVGGGWLSQNHPEWRLGPLLNLGNPDAWRWLVEHVDGQITSQGIHLYRQDFNMSPLNGWRGNDAPDRQGITENLHVQGYLAYWDELRKRLPQLLIDSCASGGRRNDLETLRRAVPLHPTDYNYSDLTTKQAFHYSLYQWIPYFGSNTCPMDRPDPYAIRSGQSLSTTSGIELLTKGLAVTVASQPGAAVIHYTRTH